LWLGCQNLKANKRIEKKAVAAAHFAWLDLYVTRCAFLEREIGTSGAARDGNLFHYRLSIKYVRE
jgi:hypothetical protein